MSDNFAIRYKTAEEKKFQISLNIHISTYGAVKTKRTKELSFYFNIPLSWYYILKQTFKDANFFFEAA